MPEENRAAGRGQSYGLNSHESSYELSRVAFLSIGFQIVKERNVRWAAGPSVGRSVIVAGPEAHRTVLLPVG